MAHQFLIEFTITLLLLLLAGAVGSHLNAFPQLNASPHLNALAGENQTGQSFSAFAITSAKSTNLSKIDLVLELLRKGIVSIVGNRQ